MNRILRLISMNRILGIGLGLLPSSSLFGYYVLESVIGLWLYRTREMSNCPQVSRGLQLVASKLIPWSHPSYSTVHSNTVHIFHMYQNRLMLFLRLDNIWAASTTWRIHYWSTTVLYSIRQANAHYCTVPEYVRTSNSRFVPMMTSMCTTDSRDADFGSGNFGGVTPKTRVSRSPHYIHLQKPPLSLSYVCVRMLPDDFMSCMVSGYISFSPSRG
jgi:hypothetical protein